MATEQEVLNAAREANAADAVARRLKGEARQATDAAYAKSNEYQRASEHADAAYRKLADLTAQLEPPAAEQKCTFTIEEVYLRAQRDPKSGYAKGDCGYCGKPVYHVNPCYTSHPKALGSKPLHDDCNKAWEAATTVTGDEPSFLHACAKLNIAAHPVVTAMMQAEARAADAAFMGEPDQPCTCPTAQLMASGCVCGAVGRRGPEVST